MKKKKFVTEIRYKETTTVESEESPVGTFTYGMALGIMITMLTFILLCVCLYNKLSSKRDKVVKEVTDQSPVEKIQAAGGRLES